MKVLKAWSRGEAAVKAEGIEWTPAGARPERRVSARRMGGAEPEARVESRAPGLAWEAAAQDESAVTAAELGRRRGGACRDISFPLSLSPAMRDSSESEGRLCAALYPLASVGKSRVTTLLMGILLASPVW